MPVEKMNFTKDQAPEAETIEEKDITRDADLMREYSMQLNGIIEDNGDPDRREE